MIDDSPLQQIIRSRRSVRRFLPQKVEPAKLIAVIEAARLAPSACNVQPWRFVVVDDPATLAALAGRALGGAVSNAFAREAPALIAVCAQLNLVTNRLAEWYKGINYHHIDIGIAGEHLVLRAQELGLGTCWLGWFNAGAVKTLLHIPQAIKVLALIAVGYYETAALPPQAGKKPLNEIMFWNRYGETGAAHQAPQPGLPQAAGKPEANPN